MHWIDIEDIAAMLEEEYSEVDINSISFTDLKMLVLELKDFDDDPKRSNERILEAIQAAWLEERGAC